jgi:hypothetical protein
MYNTTQLQPQGNFRVTNSSLQIFTQEELFCYREAKASLEQMTIPGGMEITLHATQYGWIADIQPQEGSSCYHRRVTCWQGTFKGMRSSMSGAVSEIQCRHLPTALDYLLRG